MDLASPHPARARAKRHHGPTLPLKVGTRGSPLALYQTRHFLDLIRSVCPLLREAALLVGSVGSPPVVASNCV